MPTGVSADDANAAAQPCRDLFADGAFGGATTGDPAWPTPEQLQAMPAVVAEDRGSWRFVVMSDGRWSSSCLQQRSTLDRVVSALGGGDGFAGGGGLTSLEGLPEPTAREVRTVDVMGSSVSGTLRASSSVSSVTGRVGADVAGVVIEPVGHPKVMATVADGWFAGWWPEADAELAVDFGLTVTLRDGTTVHYAAGSDQATPLAGGSTKS